MFGDGLTIGQGRIGRIPGRIGTTALGYSDRYLVAAQMTVLNLRNIEGRAVVGDSSGKVVWKGSGKERQLLGGSKERYEEVMSGTNTRRHLLQNIMNGKVASEN